MNPLSRTFSPTTSTTTTTAASTTTSATTTSHKRPLDTSDQSIGSKRTKESAASPEMPELETVPDLEPLTQIMRDHGTSTETELAERVRQFTLLAGGQSMAADDIMRIARQILTVGDDCSGIKVGVMIYGLIAGLGGTEMSVSNGSALFTEIVRARAAKDLERPLYVMAQFIKGVGGKELSGVNLAALLKRTLQFHSERSYADLAHLVKGMTAAAGGAAISAEKRDLMLAQILNPPPDSTALTRVFLLVGLVSGLGGRKMPAEHRKSLLEQVVAASRSCGIDVVALMIRKIGEEYGGPAMAAGIRDEIIAHILSRASGSSHEAAEMLGGLAAALGGPAISETNRTALFAQLKARSSAYTKDQHRLIMQHIGIALGGPAMSTVNRNALLAVIQTAKSDSVPDLFQGLTEALGARGMTPANRTALFAKILKASADKSEMQTMVERFCTTFGGRHMNEMVRAALFAQILEASDALHPDLVTAITIAFGRALGGDAMSAQLRDATIKQLADVCNTYAPVDSTPILRGFGISLRDPEMSGRHLKALLTVGLDALTNFNTHKLTQWVSGIGAALYGAKMSGTERKALVSEILGLRKFFTHRKMAALLAGIVLHFRESEDFRQTALPIKVHSAILRQILDASRTLSAGAMGAMFRELINAGQMDASSQSSILHQILTAHRTANPDQLGRMIFELARVMPHTVMLPLILSSDASPMKIATMVAAVTARMQSTGLATPTPTPTSIRKTLDDTLNALALEKPGIKGLLQNWVELGRLVGANDVVGVIAFSAEHVTEPEKIILIDYLYSNLWPVDRKSMPVQWNQIMDPAVSDSSLRRRALSILLKEAPRNKAFEALRQMHVDRYSAIKRQEGADSPQVATWYAELVELYTSYEKNMTGSFIRREMDKYADKGEFDFLPELARKYIREYLKKCADKLTAPATVPGAALGDVPG